MTKTDCTPIKTTSDATCDTERVYQVAVELVYTNARGHTDRQK